MEFFIAILLIFLPDGRVGMETLAVPSYNDCSRLVQGAEAEAKTKYPGADIRTSCVSSESIGQNGA